MLNYHIAYHNILKNLSEHFKICAFYALYTFFMSSYTKTYNINLFIFEIAIIKQIPCN